MDILQIDKALIPYSFDIQLDGTTYDLTIRYNAEYDFFTMDIAKDEMEILNGEKIVYGRPLFEAHRHLDLPTVLILPVDMSEEQTRAGYEQLSDTVFLYMLGSDES